MFNNKIKMKKLIGFILCFFAVTVMAQHDPEAKEILDRVSEKTKTYQTIKVQFTNTLVNEVENFSESLQGTIYLKGNMYKLDFMDTETFCDGKTKWIYLKDFEEVNIANVEPIYEDESEVESEILNNPRKIFTIYEDGFKYMYLEDKLMDNITVSVIDLIPESLEKNYSRIRLFINKSEDQLYSIKYFSKDGNNYIFKLNSFETNQSYEDSFFVFDVSKHPEVEVIDLRD